MDPELQQIGLQLGEVAVRNTAGAVADRVLAAKAKRQAQQTIAELEDIITNLLSDKSELARIAQAYEEELVAQRISASDIEYISNNFVPLLNRLIQAGAEKSGQDDVAVQEIIDLIRPILSVETVTVLQLVGFNFRRAIGEPLTQLVAQLILSRSQGNATAAHELQRLNLLREVAYLEIARDPNAHERLLRMMPPSV